MHCCLAFHCDLALCLALFSVVLFPWVQPYYIPVCSLITSQSAVWAFRGAGCSGWSFSNSQQSTDHACCKAVLCYVVSGVLSGWFVWDCVPSPSPRFVHLGTGKTILFPYWQKYCKQFIVVFWLPYCHTLWRHLYLICIIQKSWISLERDEIWQKEKHHSSLLKAFQIRLFFNTSIFHFIGTLID